MPTFRLVPTSREFRIAVVLLMLAPLAGCAQFDGRRAPKLTEDGRSTAGIYTVTAANVDPIRQRAAETLNVRRARSGLAPVQMDPRLNAAAGEQSGAMMAQGRAWPFGPNGETPPQRARLAGFPGRVIGEVVSETYESEVLAIDAWMSDPAQRAILMDPDARAMGLGVAQDASLKKWWTLTVAAHPDLS
ncbi:MAG: CAP domain-containing protein [Paracoccus sp. (in: a-proteobacteria)]|uniref:CAP domain-containing protein n=1 Tax=Paracoccus sp. TaxID=267 RepID=UPI00391C2EC0